MNDSSTNRWAQIKQRAPTAVSIVCGIAFMNAKDAETAGLFGSLGLGFLAWTIYQSKQVPKTLGEPVMVLGPMTAIGPARMAPWYTIAVLAFGFLGVASFFSLAEARWQLRWGLPLVIFSIIGTFLIMLSPKFRRFGLSIFGCGLLLAGLLFAWAAVDAVQSREDDWALEAAKCAVFAAFMLLPGITSVAAILLGGGRPPIYSSGVVGSHGFVPWQHVERLELIDSGGRPTLAVGAYGGWTLLIDVNEKQREQVMGFIANVRDVPTTEPLSRNS